MPYRIDYVSAAVEHLRGLSARDQAVILEAVSEQLSHQPAQVTRNRKRLRPNPLAPWQLRVGELRVFYDIEDTPEPTVVILAAGLRWGTSFASALRSTVYETVGTIAVYSIPG